MIKPIDTQILYPQTPELANRQQNNNQIPSLQQEQFANIMQKEVESKKDTIIPTAKTENLKTNKDAQRQKNDGNSKQMKQQARDTTQNKRQASKKDTNNTIDIRI